FLEEGLSEAEREKRMAEDPDYKKAYLELAQEVQKAWNEANRIQGEKASIIGDDLIRKEAAQEKLATFISMVSPLSDFTYLATDLSSTGIRSQEHFGQIAGQWWVAFGDYSKKKMASILKENPAADVWNTPVDVSDRPRFQYKEEALIGRFKGTLSFFVVLIVYNFIFFIAAYFSFVRYDVR
ncbi:MAG: hypothetical protein KAW19_00155, partial [Candidatus Aminicenantes bacterium]|nr:hypothetical protein [Candidatus Aminicenantes bacterium]